MSFSACPGNFKLLSYLGNVQQYIVVGTENLYKLNFLIYQAIIVYKFISNLVQYIGPGHLEKNEQPIILNLNLKV